MDRICGVARNLLLVGGGGGGGSGGMFQTKYVSDKFGRPCLGFCQNLRLQKRNVLADIV